LCDFTKQYAAVAYVREVFDHFHEKTVVVLGAAKMGELTLKHLGQLRPQRILVANRSPEKAEAVTRGCGGKAVRWEQLDTVFALADIFLGTNGGGFHRGMQGDLSYKEIGRRMKRSAEGARMLFTRASAALYCRLQSETTVGCVDFPEHVHANKRQ